MCGLKMKTRLNGSHLKRVHNITLSDYIKKFPKSIIGKRTPKKKTYKCEICKKLINSTSALSQHLKLKHKETLENYYVKYYLNNLKPKCECGCGEYTVLENMDNGFFKYKHNHSSPFIKNNEEYKKRKTFISWNTGLTKNIDDRLKECSNSIKLSWNKENLKQRSNSYKQKMIEKYGVENGFQLESVKEKSKKTLIKKYGVEHIQFSNEMKYKWKEYTLPSGKKAKYQGYENFGFDLLLKENDESDIINDRVKIPKIKYIEDGKIRQHCPDFFILSKNLLIDVKSIFTYNLHKQQMSLKQAAAIADGYEYQIHIFNRNGTINKIL